MYDDYMLCKVTLGVLKGASKLNGIIIIIYVSGDIGCSVLGALAGELGVDDGMLFAMRFLPCMIVWPFMAQWCVWV